MPLTHYQDALYLMQSNTYEHIPGEHEESWKSLRQITNNHYYVLYKLGTLREKIWQADGAALVYYFRAKTNMDEYNDADFKMASLYERHNNIDNAIKIYKDIISRIWEIKKEEWEECVENSEKNNMSQLLDNAQNMTVQDMGDLIKAWDNLLKIITENKRDSYKKYYDQARLELSIVRAGVDNNLFIEKLFAKDNKQDVVKVAKKQISDKFNKMSTPR